MLVDHYLFVTTATAGGTGLQLLFLIQILHAAYLDTLCLSENEWKSDD